MKIKYIFTALLCLIFTQTAFAEVNLPTGGDLSVTKISPEWVSVEEFGPVNTASAVVTRVYTIKSSTGFTVSQDASISGSSNFIVESNSNCKSGFVFTTSNYCNLRISFNGNNLPNFTHNATANFNGLTIPLKATVNLKLPVFQLTDYNGDPASMIEFNNLFNGDNNPQIRTVYFKDFNKSTTVMPMISLNGTDFTITHTCTLAQINSDLGCPVNFNFNPQNKSVNNYLTYTTFANKLIYVHAQVLSSAAKGTTPKYIITKTTGEQLTNWMIGSFSKFSSSQSDIRLYIRDINRVNNLAISYNFATPTGTPFGKVYNSCSASNLKGSYGCLVRLSVSNANLAVGNYSNQIIFNNSNLLNLEFNVNDNNPSSKSPKLALIGAGGRIHDEYLMREGAPGSGSTIVTLTVKDLNQSTFPSNLPINLTGISSPLSLSYNSCTDGSRVNDGSGCIIKLFVNFNGQSIGNYNQTLTSDLGPIAKLNYNVLGNSCNPGISQACSLVNGTGIQECNSTGTSFSSCKLTACNSDYHTEDGLTCVSNTESCTIANGTGSNWWLGNQWTNQCGILSCETGFHAESGQCLSNTQSCSENNGQGTKDWSGTSYSSCEIASCDAGYFLMGNSCEPIFINNFSAPLSAGASNMGLKWNGSEYHAIITACLEGYYLDSQTSQCVSNQNLPAQAVVFLDGDVGCGEYYKFHYDSQTNKTTCVSMETNSLTLTKVGSVDPQEMDHPKCLNGQTKTSSEVIVYPEWFGLGSSDKLKITCINLVCQPNYDIKQYNIYRDNNGQFSYVPKDTDTGTTFIGMSERTCNVNGTGFSPHKMVSCDESSNFYLNINNGICEKFATVQDITFLDPYSNTNRVAAKLYHNTELKKWYLKTARSPGGSQPFGIYKWRGYYVRNVIERTSGDRCDYVLNANNRFTEIECSYGNSNAQNVIADFTYSFAHMPVALIDDSNSNSSYDMGNHVVFADIEENTSTNHYDPNTNTIDYITHSFKMLSSARGTYGGVSWYSIATNYPDSYVEHQCLTGYRYYENDWIDANGNTIHRLGKCLGSALNDYCDANDGLMRDAQHRTMPFSDNTMRTFRCTSKWPPYSSRPLAFVPYYWEKYQCFNGQHTPNYGQYGPNGENALCIDNIQPCSTNELQTGQVSGVKYWIGKSSGAVNTYTNCRAVDDNSCESDRYYEAGTLQCELKVQTDNFYNLETGAVIGSYTRTRNSNGTWSEIINCNTGYHVENSYCESNTRTLKISDGNGKEICTWNSLISDYDSCTISCNCGIDDLFCYEQSGNSCSLAFVITQDPTKSSYNMNDQINLSVSSVSGTIINFMFNNQTVGFNAYTSLNKSTLNKVSSTKAVYTAGKYIKNSNQPDTVLETIIVSDNAGHSKDVKINLQAYGLVCPYWAPQNQQTQFFPLKNAVNGYRLWTGTEYASACENAYQCLSGANLENYEGREQCLRPVEECEVLESTDPNIAPNTDGWNGRKAWNPTTRQYGACNSYLCKNGGSTYKMADGNYRCQTNPFITNDRNLIKDELLRDGDSYQEGASYLTQITTFAVNNEYPTWSKFVLHECPANKRLTIDGNRLKCEEYNHEDCYIDNSLALNDRNYNHKSSAACGDSLSKQKLLSDVRVSENRAIKVYKEYDGYSFYRFNVADFPKAKCYNPTALDRQGGFLYRKGYGSGKNRWVIVLQGGGACGEILSHSETPVTVNTCSAIPSGNWQTESKLLPNSTYSSVFYEESEFNINSAKNGEQAPVEGSNAELFLGLVGDIVITNPTDGSTTLADISGDNGLIGILSNRPEINDEFKSWNHVLVRYCSQDLWAGKGSDTGGNHNGQYILEAALKTLKRQVVPTARQADLPDLDDAQNIIFGGYSAGGEGIWYNGDYIKNIINDDNNLSQENKNKRLTFLVDSGWINNYTGGWDTTVSTTNFVEVFNHNLVEVWKGDKTDGTTFFGANVSQTQPTFVIQDAFDHEFLNYNANLVGDILLADPLLEAEFGSNGGYFLPIYACNSLNGDKVDEYWSDNLYAKLYLFKNYLSNDFYEVSSNNYQPKIFQNYSGIYLNKGRHGFTTSDDWNNVNIPVTENDETTNASIRSRFSAWYFNNTPTKINLMNYSNIETTSNLETYLKGSSMCGGVLANPYQLKNKYLDKDFLNKL